LQSHRRPDNTFNIITFVVGGYDDQRFQWLIL
jgi:hypothetical protein